MCFERLNRRDRSADASFEDEVRDLFERYRRPHEPMRVGDEREEDGITLEEERRELERLGT